MERAVQSPGGCFSDENYTMANWRDFESLIAQIYKELEPSAKVTQNDKIIGQDSKAARQIDVSIRYTIAGHNLLTVIQAKDSDNPADINIVGEFATVIKDVRANKGILICKGGFTSGARLLADNLGIDLCNIHDAQSRRWSLDVNFPILWIDLLPTVRLNMKVRITEPSSFPEDPTAWVISGDKGKTRLTSFDAFVKAWNDGNLNRSVGQTHFVRSEQTAYELLVKNEKDELIWQTIDDLYLSYRVSRKAWLGYFSPEECRGILHYEDGRFVPSYLPIGALPQTPSADWKEIEDPDKLAVTIPGLLVTTERWQVDPRSMRPAGTEIKRISD